ncbi:MAG: riboflavin synthase [Chloroflexi bacterium]|nr:riboflavin synthase [Chloroflexota bacterium]
MFTGIVEEVGRVKSGGRGRLTISARKVLEGTKLGDSIAVNGACLTVVEMTDGAFSIEVMPETERRTSLGSLRPGDPVNLERALAVGARLGGHFVQGHVDGTGKVLSLAPEGSAVLMRVSAPPPVMRYIVEKGFIAVEGISLTVVHRDADSFTVSLVGFTREHTTLSAKRSGDPVNLEADIIAKYVEQLANPGKSGLTAEFLREHGFA